LAHARVSFSVHGQKHGWSLSTKSVALAKL